MIFLGGKMTKSYPFDAFGDEFKGKRVLVTGGTKGVGAAIVRRFELSGASVATTARAEPAHGQDSALFIKADLGTARGVQNVFDCIQQKWGGLEVLVNNVGGTETKQADSRCSPKRTGKQCWRSTCSPPFALTALSFPA